MLLYVRQWLGFGDQNVRSGRANAFRGFLLTVAAMLALGCLVFSLPVHGLDPVLFVAIVFAVFRYGQLAAACGVIAYAIAGIARQPRRRQPGASSTRAGHASMVLQVQMLLMLATALPLAAMLMTRDRLEPACARRTRTCAPTSTILNLTKTLAGIGRWQYNLETGEQNWSEKMLTLNGLSAELAPDPGDIRHAVVRSW